LAWLLQSTEVALLRKAWHNFILAGIPFLTFHGKVIVLQTEQQQAFSIFSSVLANLFVFSKSYCIGFSHALLWAGRILVFEASQYYCMKNSQFIYARRLAFAIRSGTNSLSIHP
jgi:hypothetical protein